MKHSWIAKPTRGLLRWLLGVAMLSTAIANVQAIACLDLNPGRHRSLFDAGLGFGAGLVLFSLVSPFLRLYVLGHELSHWLAAKIFRRRTAGLRVGRGGGSVKVERPNIWITLAPYFLPFYTLVWIGAASLVRVWYAPPWTLPALYAGIGFTYAYHVVTTILALLRGQQDLHVVGPVLALLLIVMMNATILFWGLAGGSRGAGRGLRCLRDAYRGQYHALRHAARAF